MKRKIIIFCLSLFLIADFSYSFLQFYSMTLDGDMAGGIVPADDVKPVLNSPLGLDIFLKDKNYPNPNRYFSHSLFKMYFSTVPFFLQKFTDPITSIYLSCSIAKLIFQIGFVFITALFITGFKKIVRFEFLIALVLLTPLFQINYYRMDIGVIDKSTTYCFFYAFPFLLLLIYFIPFISILLFQKNQTIHPIIKLLWIPFALIISLSGPLNPGIVLVFSLIVVLNKVLENYRLAMNIGFLNKIVRALKSIPHYIWFYLFPICLFSLYSLYLGTFNSIEIDESQFVSLMDIYMKLPKGIYVHLIQNLGFLIMFFILVINLLIIHFKLRTNEGIRILNSMKWILIFSIIYILLIPLGGYRSWRPDIVRHDTLIPITVSLIFAFGISTIFILKNETKNAVQIYLPLIFLVLFIYKISDKPNFSQNHCERIALKEVLESNISLEDLNCNCKVMSWDDKPKQISYDINTKLLKYYGIYK